MPLGEFAVETGFSADYALYVHEMTDDAYSGSINWTETGSGAKFLERAMQRGKNWIVEIIRKNAAVDSMVGYVGNFKGDVV
jgi:hypothetical protein